MLIVLSLRYKMNNLEFLNLLQAFDGSFIPDLSGIESRLGLEHQDVCFLLSRGLVLDSTRNDKHLPFSQQDVSVSQLELEISFDDQKKLVLVFVLMPYKLALYFRELYVLTIELSDDLGGPIVVNLRELLGQICFIYQDSLIVSFSCEAWLA